MAPDVDAVTSVWLLKRFLPGWDEVEVAFVPAGKTLNNEIPDTDPDILHVDTGMGMLDHHQTDEDTCAAKRTVEFISQYQKSAGKNYKKHFPDEALVRLVDVVNDIDHFREASYPNPGADFYDFGMVAVLDGWRLLYPDDHKRVTRQGMEILDGLYKTFQNKLWAEKEIQENGTAFTTKWGDGMAVETVNDEVLRVAQLRGSIIVVRKDPKKGFVRIKALPESSADLTKVYNRIRKLDPQATWYLHASKRMVLNGSSKNPDSRATKLTLREVVDVLKRN